MKFTPARIDTDFIRPTPEGYSASCVSCLFKGSGWVIGTIETADVWCSFCFLNRTEWAKANQEGIIGLAKCLEVENNIKALAEDGQSVTREVSDRILGAIVSASRTMKMLRNQRVKS
jgi:hypothetical protein